MDVERDNPAVILSEAKDPALDSRDIPVKLGIPRRFAPRDDARRSLRDFSRQFSRNCFMNATVA